MRSILNPSVYLSAVLLLAFYSCKPSSGQFEDPVAYNDSIVNRLDKMADASYAVTDALNAQEPEKAEQKRVEYIRLIKDNMEAFKKFGDYKGNKSLQEAALKHSEFYLQVAENDFKELIRQVSDYKKDPSSEEAAERFNKLNEELDAKTARADKAFNETQEQFAKKFNFDIIVKTK